MESRNPVSTPFALLMAAVSAAIIAVGPALAGPQGGKVISGDVGMKESPQRLDITQNSEKAIIDWLSFSIDADELVRFWQPSSSSMALNRVRGGAYSAILGQLIANGRIFLINPNGILFGKNARIDVGGLVATTIDISDEDFLEGRLGFNQSSNPGGTVVNRGQITAAESGLVALVAPGVENSGIIQARLGRVALASGNSFTLDLHGDNLIQFAVDDSVAETLFAPDGTKLNALVGNSGSIVAEGGTVILTAASAARDVVDNVINVDGIVEARSAVKRNGQIVLQGRGEGIVRVSGALDASGRGTGETGGKIKVLGEKVGIVGDARVDVSGDVGGGEILAGGNFQGNGPERNADYTTIGSDVEIRADAITGGDGGRVIVWSDRVTRFFGTISARGGAGSGNGGFAEVSGKTHLLFAPTAIDMGAPNGLTGQLLLDPRDITISDGDGTDDSKIGATDTSINFGDDSGSDYKIKPSAFETINADVTLQASRDITISSAIDRSGAANSTLYLQAGRHLTINANITGTNGAHSFVFEADSPRSSSNNGTGKLTIGSNVTITSNNGSITLIGAAFDISSTASINAGSGAINVAPSRSVAMAINTTANNLSNAEIGRFTTSGTITIGTATTGPTGTNTAGSTISASSITIGETVSVSGSASLTINSGGTTTLSADVSTEDGDITFGDPVTLGATANVVSDSDNDLTDGNITFSSTVNGGHSLTLDANGGTVTVSGAIGGTTRLTNLTASGGAVSLMGVKTTGFISVTGPETDPASISLAGAYESNDGNIRFAGTVSLAAAVSVDSDSDEDSTDGTITFTSTVNGGHSLTLDADTAAVRLSSAVGGTTRLTSLTVSGGQIDLASVATTGAIDIGGTNIDLNGGSYTSQDGDITFTGSVDLIVNVTVDSDQDDDGTDGNITFSSQVNGARTLTVDADGGDVAFRGSVGAASRLTSLTVDGGQIDLSFVQTTGAIDIEGTRIDLNSGTYGSNDGNITFDGPVHLHNSNVSVHSNQDNDTAKGSITFTSTVDGPLSGAALNLVGGSVELRGAVGGAIVLTNLSISGDDITLGAVSLVGTLTLTPSGTITLKGNISLNDTAVSFSRPVVLGADVSIDTDRGDNGTGGNITFSSTVNGGHSLTLDAGTRSVTFSGAVGGGTRLTSLTVDGGQIDLASVATTGAIDIEGTNIDLNGASYSSNDGNITFTGAVDLHANVRVDSDQDNDGTDGTITFTSTVNGGRTLTIDADSGAVALSGAIGGTTKLTGLTVSNAGQVDVNSIKTSGAISVKGTNIDLNSGVYESDDGAIKFDGSVDLTVNTTVDSDKDNDGTDGKITFTSTVNAAGTGTRSLTLDADDGDVELRGAVGGTAKLTNLTITGDDVTLGAVSLTGTLTLTPTGTITLKGNITVDDSTVTFSRPVVLGANVRIDTDGDNDGFDGDITFSSTVNGGHSLTLDAHDGGAVAMSGAIGGATRLTSLTIVGDQIDLNTVATTGAISVSGANIDLNGTTYGSQDGNIRFAGRVDLHANVTVDSDQDNDGNDGSITFTSDVNAASSGTQSLTLDADGGSVTLSGAVGGSARPSRLTIDGGQIDLSTVATIGAIDIEGTNIDLKGATYGSFDGNITFDGPVDLHTTNVSVQSNQDTDAVIGSITFTSTVNGLPTGSSLALIGADVELRGAVGGTTKLTSLNIFGVNVTLGAVTLSGVLQLVPTGTITLKGDITVDDSAVSFSRPVVLGANVTIDTDGDNDAANGNITFSSTVNGGHSLTLDTDGGSVRLSGAVGGTTKLTGLTVLNAGQVDVNSIRTTGAISVKGTNIDLNSGVYESDDGAITFDGPVDLTVNTTVDSDKDNDNTDGKIEFTSTINGAHALTLDASTGAVELKGAIGGTTKLTGLTVSNAGQVDVNSIKTTGAISVKGTNIDLNSGVYESDDGAITFTGPVDLHTNVMVDSDKDNDNTDGKIEFTSTINGAHSLTLDASTGAVELKGAVGGTTRLTGLTVSNAGQVDLNTVATTGAIDIKGSNIDLNGATYRSQDGNITFNGPVDLHTNVTVNSDQDNDGTDGTITFTSTVNAASAGTQSLTLAADDGDVELRGAVGVAAKLNNLSITGDDITLGAVTLAGTLTLTPDGTITLKGNITVDDTAVSFSRPVVLGTNVRIDTDGDSDGTDGNITFSSTVNGGHSLTLDADTAAVTLSGSVGGTTKLTSLTVDGGQIDLNTVATTGAIDIDGSNIDLNAGSYGSQGGNITFTGPVDLDHSSGVTVTTGTGAGNISFSSTVNGGRALTVSAGSGSVTFSGAVGGSTALTGFNVTGNAVSLRSVRVTGTGTISVTGSGGITLHGTYRSANRNIDFNSAVTLAGAVTVNSGTGGGNVAFDSTVNGGHALTVEAGTGSVTLGGNVTLSGANALTVNGGGGIAVGANVSTVSTAGGAISFGDAVTLSGSNALTVTTGMGAGNISFGLTVSGSRALTVEAGSGSVTLDHNVTLAGTNKALTVNGGGGIAVGANVSTVSTAGGAISFGDAVTLSGSNALTVTTGTGAGNISFGSTVNGGRALTVSAGSGSVTFSGAVGGSTALTGFNVTGNAVSLRSVRVTGTGTISVTGSGGITLHGTYRSANRNIDFNSTVTLAGAVTVNSGTGGGNVAFDSTVNGGHALTVEAGTGSVTFSGAVGGTTKLTSLTVSNAGQVDVNSIKTTGAISVKGTNIDLNSGVYETDDGSIKFDGPVDLTVNTTIDSDKDNDGTDGKIEFTSTINGAHSLILDASTGAVELKGAVGGTTKLTSLTVDGGQIDLNTVATTGSIDIEGTNIDLNAGSYGSQGGNITFTGPVDLDHSSGVTVTTGTGAGNISFSSTVNGGRALTVSAGSGSVTFSGAVGGSTALTGFNVTGNAVSLRSVRVTGTGTISVTGSGGITLHGTYRSANRNIDFNSAVTLAGAVTVNSGTGGGNVAFDSTVNGGHALTVEAGTGSVTFSGAVGGGTRLTSLTVDGGQIDLNTVATTGVIDIEGTNIDLNAGSYGSQGGNITFTGPVDLDHSSGVTVTTGTGAGNISFSSTVNGGRALTVEAGTGSVTFSGAVGGGTRLTSLTVDGGQIDLNTVATTGAIDIDGSNIDLNAGSYGSQGGNITFTGPVDLDHSSGVTVTTGTGAGNISFSSTVNGGRALTVSAGSGSVTFSGAVGGSTALTGFNVTGNAVSLRSVRVTGTGTISVTGSGGITLHGTYRSANRNIDFNSAVTLAGAVTVNSGTGGGNVAFDSTVNGGHALTVEAGTGSVTFSGAVGGTTKLTSLTVSNAGQVDVNSIKTTGAMSVKGTNIDLNSGVYESDDGAIKFDGPVDLTVNTTIDSDKDNDGTDGKIEFTSTINGARSLTLDASTGAVELKGAVGGTTKLTGLTVDGGQIDIASVATTGAIDIEGTNIDLNGATYESEDGNIRFAGPVDLHSNVSVDSDKDDDTTDGSITFTSTIDAAFRGVQSLTLDAGAGTITVEGAIGGTTALRDLTTNGGSVVLKGGYNITGNIEVTGAITLGEGEYNSGSANFAGAVTLSGNVTVTSGGNAGDSITFGSTITGAYSLVLNAGAGSITISGEAGTENSPLASLTVTGGSTSLNSVKTTGSISITGTAVNLNGMNYRSNDGDISFNSPTNLNTDVTMDSDANDDGTAGSITFAGAVDGAGHTLTIVRADDVTVQTTMTVASFRQLAGTGTTDLGSNSLHSETFVDISSRNIIGTIFAEEATLKASNLVRVTVEVGSLTIEAKDAHVTGTVNELDGQAAADSVIVVNRGPGVYKANGFTILGTGPGTRTYAELSALPFPVTLHAERYSSTPASAVYGSLTPVLRASVTDATVGPYTINAHEMPFPLYTRQPSTDCSREGLQCAGLNMN